MPDGFDIVPELDVHALVEDVERSVPVAGAAEGLAVADDAAVELIDLFEPAVLHEHGQDLAADSAGAVGDDGFVLEVVVFAGFDLGDEVTRGVRVGHDRVPELPDLRLHRVATVEEDDLLAAFVEEFVQGSWFEMLAAALDSVICHGDLVRGAEGDEFVADLHAQAWEVIALAVRPFDVRSLEWRVGLRRPHVLLHVEDVPSDRGVDSVLRYDDPPLEPEALGQGVLPQLDRFGVGQRGEDIEQDDLGSCHGFHSKWGATVRFPAGNGPYPRRGGPSVDALRPRGEDTAKIGRECRVV